MARFFVESTHTPDQCLQNLDEILQQGPDKLRMWDFACAVGDHSNHRAYAFLEGQNVNAVRDQIPQTKRSQANITEVGKQTPEDIRSAHSKAA